MQRFFFFQELFLQFSSMNSIKKNQEVLLAFPSILISELEHYGWWIWMGGLLDGWKPAWALRPKGWVVNGTRSAWRPVLIFFKTSLVYHVLQWSGGEVRVHFHQTFRGHLAGARSQRARSHGHFQEHQAACRDGLTRALGNKTRTIANLCPLDTLNPHNGTGLWSSSIEKTVVDLKWTCSGSRAG